MITKVVGFHRMLFSELWIYDAEVEIDKPVVIIC